MNLYKKGIELFRKEGFIKFNKHIVRYLLRQFFEYRSYYLYENRLDYFVENQSKIKNFTFKIISATKEVDNLISEGFGINAYYSGIKAIKERISKGAILYSFFVDKELAHTSWIALTEKAKEDMDPLVYTISFQNEVCAGDSRTIEKYQGLGIYGYVWAKIFHDLNERGINKVKFAVLNDNIAPQRGQKKLGSIKYGKLRYLKLFKKEFYKENKINEHNAHYRLF